MMLWAASMELFGLLGSGVLVILASMRLYSPITVISWVLPGMSGAAQISTRGFSAPIPARERVAATLTLAGKPLAASVALPSKIRVGLLIVPRSIPISST